MKQKKVKIEDIAKAAGVSSATVSYALHNQTNKMSPETFEEILRVAKDLGYRYSVVNSRRILFLSPVPAEVGERYKNPAHMKMLAGMRFAAERSGYTLETDAVDLPDFRYKMRELNSSVYDGIILLGYYLSQQNKRFLDLCRKPLLVIDPHIPLSTVDTVLMDNSNAVLDLIDLIASYGHRRIGLISSSDEINTNFVLRRNAFIDGMKANHLLFRRDYDWRITEPFTRLKEEFSASIAHLQEKGIPLPTAFFCVNDILGFILSEVFEEKGLSISIAGYDNFIRDGKQLTTVDPAFEAIGRTAAQELISRISDVFRDPMEIKVNGRVVVRDSLKRIGS